MSKNIKLDETIGFLLNRASRTVKFKLLEAFKEKGIDISGEQWQLLVHLWEKDGRKQQDLADIMHKDKTTMVRLINSVENKNLVTRIPSETDQRTKLIYLTSIGKKLEDEIIPIVNSVFGEIEKKIDRRDYQITKKVLKEINSIFDQETLF